MARALAFGVKMTCGAMTRSGEACKNSPVRGQNLCSQHGGVALREVGVIIDERGREAWADFVSAKSVLGQALESVAGQHGSLQLDDEVDLMRALERVHLKTFDESGMSLAELTEALMRIANTLNALLRTKHAELDRMNAMVSRDVVKEEFAKLGRIIEDVAGRPCASCGVDTNIMQHILERMKREMRTF